jgi:mRNA interferase RelE/StbE
MTWELRWTPRAVKDARRLDRQTRMRIVDAIEKLADDPAIVDVRPLAGQENRWRLRVGDWRVIFWFDPADNIIYVARVAHRSTACRD